MRTIITGFLIYFVGLFIKDLIDKSSTATKNTDSPPISFPPFSPLENPMKLPKSIFGEFEDMFDEGYEYDIHGNQDYPADSKTDVQEENIIADIQNENIINIKKSFEHKADTLADKTMYKEEMDKEYGIKLTQSSLLNGIILSEVLGPPKARKVR